MATPSQEDYIEAIWILTDQKGYARVSDIADRLGVSPASVSRMVRRLNADGLLSYEKYRGLNLTPEGRRRGRVLLARHQVLELFLRELGMKDAEEIYRTVEGVEHHFGPDALVRIRALVQYAQDHREWWQHFLASVPAEGPSPCSPVHPTDAPPSSPS